MAHGTTRFWRWCWARWWASHGRIDQKSLYWPYLHWTQEAVTQRISSWRISWFKRTTSKTLSYSKRNVTQLFYFPRPNSSILLVSISSQIFPHQTSKTAYSFTLNQQLCFLPLRKGIAIWEFSRVPTLQIPASWHLCPNSAPNMSDSLWPSGL